MFQLDRNVPLGVRTVVLTHDVFIGNLVADALHLRGFAPVELAVEWSSFVEAKRWSDFNVAVVDAASEEGVAFIATLRQHAVDLPVVLISPLAERITEEELRGLGRVVLLEREHLHAATLAHAVLSVARGNVAARPGGEGTFVHLSPREREVLTCVSQGMDNLKIAALMGIGERAVKTHVTSLYRKLACETRVELALKGIQLGLWSGRE